VVIVLEMAIGILFASGAAMLIHHALSSLTRLSKERAAFKSRRSERDRGRVVKSVERILREDWEGPPVDIAQFKRVWTSLAFYLDIDSELMRPTDRVADIMVATENFGPDSFDLMEFYLDFLPRADAHEVLEDVARNENGTIGEMIREVLQRQGRHEEGAQ